MKKTEVRSPFIYYKIYASVELGFNTILNCYKLKNKDYEKVI